jgi:two-component system sensor histidine kinase BaeS
VRWIGCLFVAVLALAVLGGAVAGGLMARLGFLPVLVLAAVFALVLLAGGVTGMRRVTRPMDDLIEGAERIEHGDYSVHVPETGARELRSVARAFNAMSARLKSSDERRRTFLADVTHELRTPLTVIRGQAEGIADGLYPGDAEHLTPILTATRSLELLVEDLRTLALTESGSLALNREATDAAPLVHDALASFHGRAEAAGVTLSAEIAEGLPALDVDPVRIRSVLGNLLANAVRHTPKGGSVRVAAAPDGDLVALTVTDTGTGIPPELLPRVFDRFVKGAGSSGSGLGLAIVHDIVVAHGGTIDIESSAGAGTTARMRLPAIPLPR